MNFFLAEATGKSGLDYRLKIDEAAVCNRELRKFVQMTSTRRSTARL